MGYSWMYLGDAELPVERVPDWLGAKLGDVDLTVLVGLDDWGLEPGSPESCVKDVLGELANEEVARVDTGPKVVVRVLADKSGDAWLTWRGDLVAAFLALAQHGGSGRLDVVGFFDGPEDGFRVEVAGKRAVVRTLTEAEVEEVRQGAATQELTALAEKAYGLEGFEVGE